MQKKIFLDSNIILDLYRGRTNLKDFKSLSSKKVFVTAKQVIDEFRRNRFGVISSEDTPVIKGIKEFKELSFDKYKNILKDDEFDEVKKKKSEINDKIKDIESLLNNKDSKDQISIEVEKLFSLKSTLLIDDSEECLKKARDRYDLGRIPKSDGKLTLCDQYIWELILAQNFKDLIFVSRDDTYQDNIDLLANEYKEKTGGNITIVSSLKDGMKVLEESNEEKIEEIVKKSSDDYKKQSFNDYLKIIGDLVAKTNSIGLYLQNSELQRAAEGLSLSFGKIGSYIQDSGLQDTINGMTLGASRLGSYWQNSELQKAAESLSLGFGRVKPYIQNPAFLDTINGMTLGASRLGSYWQNSELQYTIKDMTSGLYKIESYFKENDKEPEKEEQK